MGQTQNAARKVGFDRNVANLRKRYLIERYPQSDTPYLSIHRSLQRNIINRLLQEPDKYSIILDRVTQLVRSAFPQRTDREETKSPRMAHTYERYISQLTRFKDIIKDHATAEPRPLIFNLTRRSFVTID